MVDPGTVNPQALPFGDQEPQDNADNANNAKDGDGTTTIVGDSEPTIMIIIGESEPASPPCPHAIWLRVYRIPLVVRL